MHYLRSLLVTLVLVAAACVTPATAKGLLAAVTRPAPIIVAPYCTSKSAVLHVLELYRSNKTPSEGNAAWDQYVKTGKCFNTAAVVVNPTTVGEPFVLPNGKLMVLQVMQATRSDGVIVFYLTRVG